MTLDGQVFACKKCKKCFRKDAAEFEERYAYPTFDREGVYSGLILPTLYAVTNTARTAIITLFLRPSHRSRVCRWRETMRAWTTGISKTVPDSVLDQSLTIPRMLKDDRVGGEQEKSIFNFKDVSDRMG